MNRWQAEKSMPGSPSQPGSKRDLKLPRALADAPVRRLMRPLAKFLEIESASGVLLVVCTVIALVVANSPWSHAWESFWHTEISVTIGSFTLHNSLGHWINDGLMTIFFFVVGLEIKREMLDGELRSLQRAALPLVAALGGMLIPAAIYLSLQGGREGHHGWGIPMATDIAFAVGILALLGQRVPAGLKIFLLALAIADDIGAILVIALFYSSNVNLPALLLAGAGLALVVAMNRLGVRSVVAYSMAGGGIWLAMDHSGIHPTVAGVVLGLLTPGRAWVSRESLVSLLLDAVDRLDGQIDRPHEVGQLTESARETISPLERLESKLHLWVAFVIMPLFALANAGVVLRLDAASHGIAWAVAAGLSIGKPVGILLLSWLAVRTGLARLPTRTTWAALLGASCLGGIGFTMSLFIAALALEGKLLDSAKIGTLAGSAISAFVGYFILLTTLKADAGGDDAP